MARLRKIRKDCNYVIYEMKDELGENYIGLTRKSQPNVTKVIAERWRKHKSRARNENRDWVLYQYLKMGAVDWTWTHRVLAIVRGRAEAYALERVLVKAQKPTLNDQYIG